MKKYQGIAASKGIAFGPIFQYRQLDFHIEKYHIEDVRTEWERLQKALKEASHQLEEVKSQALNQAGAGEAAIFDAQQAILNDPELLAMVRNNISTNQVNIENVWMEATEYYAVMLEGLANELLSARAADVRDVSNRVLHLLLGIKDEGLTKLTTPSVIIATDLTPSDTINLNKTLVLGFCTAKGGLTSHTAILARSLGLPALVGADENVIHLKQNSPAIIDGTQGKLILEPTEEVVQEYHHRQEEALVREREAISKSHKPAITIDGKQVEVVANIEDAEGAKKAIELGAEGVGLLRTEFLYLERFSVPNEEDQYAAYKAILDIFAAKPVVMRTMDIGGDKEIPYLNIEREMNSFLGVRGLRLCLARYDLFKPQLRAALRAGVGHNLRIMFPMVATASEVRQARAVMDECINELNTEGKGMAKGFQVGIMVEIPSAALLADSLAKEVDFFSIGTNDLTQYTLAADRTNSELAYLSDALSPAVLMLIQNVIRAAHNQGKWVGLCGELAGEPQAIPILLGLGLDEFSMNPAAIPTAKSLIRSLSVPACQQIAEKVMTLSSAQEVHEYVTSCINFQPNP